MSSHAYSDEKIKQPNVAGAFYEADSKKLSNNIDQFFKKANVKEYDHPISVVIAPHAGYFFSGQTAAIGFKSLNKQSYTTIVILAPSHFVGFQGISVWGEGGFETPLGIVDVNKEFAQQLLDSSDQVYFNEDAFAKEHSLEVEIPFLQKTFSNFNIVPVIMGQPDISTMRSFAQTLKDIIGNREDVLIVVSTDLSHYHDDVFARKMDAQTIKAIEKLDINAFVSGHQNKSMESCGFIPVLTSLLYAREKGLNEVDVLNYSNSSEASGDTDRVVGYTSIVMYQNDDKRPQDLTLEQKRKLFKIAKETIHEYVKNGKKLNFEEGDERLKVEEGAFVTITKKGQLRGCIGNVLGSGPLYKTVRNMAIAAVSQDPRFKPVTPDEIDIIEIEVSVLSKPWKIDSIDEIKLGTHGVIISKGFKSGLFLPEVATDFGFTKEEFLSRLASEKAHLAPNAWRDPKTTLKIFTTTKFTEKDLK